jgi:hypothetical protein
MVRRAFELISSVHAGVYSIQYRLSSNTHWGLDDFPSLMKELRHPDMRAEPGPPTAAEAKYQETSRLSPALGRGSRQVLVTAS